MKKKKMICPDYQPDCDTAAPQCVHRKPHVGGASFGCGAATCLKYDDPFPVRECVEWVPAAKKTAEKIKKDLAGLFEL